MAKVMVHSISMPGLLSGHSYRQPQHKGSRKLKGSVKMMSTLSMPALRMTGFHSKMLTTISARQLGTSHQQARLFCYLVLHMQEFNLVLQKPFLISNWFH
ncbi:hypothetical protein CR513_30283, partial [Mucuna pruriens]